MLYFKKIIFIVSLSSCIYKINAQSLVMTMSSTTVDIGEPLELKFSLDCKGDDLKFDSTYFSVLHGPYNFSSMSVTKGVVSQIYGLKYLIEFKIGGTLILEPATVKVNNKIIQSNKIVIHVNNTIYKGDREKKLDEFKIKPHPGATPISKEDLVKMIDTLGNSKKTKTK